MAAGLQAGILETRSLGKLGTAASSRMGLTLYIMYPASTMLGEVRTSRTRVTVIQVDMTK